MLYKISIVRINVSVIIMVVFSVMNRLRIVRATPCFVSRHQASRTTRTSSSCYHPLMIGLSTTAGCRRFDGHLSFFFKKSSGRYRNDRKLSTFSLRSTAKENSAIQKADDDSLSASASNFSSFPMSMTDIKGIIFDMDGTLTKPCIDFPDMRRRIYKVASEDMSKTVEEGCVLEIATKLSPRGQAQCQEVFEDIEAKAIRDMTFMDGLSDLLKFLDNNNVPRAVLTRNVQRSVTAMHTKLADWHDIHDPFHPAVARDTASPDENTLIRAKPEPDGIWYICNEWQCDPSQVIMVGDSDQDDIVAAYRAGCGASVLLMDSQKVHDNNSGNDHDSDPSERQPTIQIDSLSDLHDLLLYKLEQNKEDEEETSISL